MSLLRKSIALAALLVATIVSAPGCALGAERRPFTVDDLLAVRRIGGIQVSPDGSRVAYVVSTPDLGKNSVTGHVWIVQAAGGEPRQLTNHPKGEGAPVWSPDSRQIAFVSARDGTPQVWRICVDGGEAVQVTTLSTGASSPAWSPDGTLIAFLSEVWPDVEGGDAGQRKRAEVVESSGVKARVIDHLLYRHFDSWTDGKRTHLLVIPAPGGEARDLTPGDSDVLGGSGGFSFSPDSKEIVFTRSPVSPGTRSGADIEAWSTNADLWAVPVAGGDTVCLTAGNRGWDGDPRWSRDGRFVAFRSQARDGYEADRFRVAILERSTGQVSHVLPADLDISAEEILWAPDSRTIYVGAEEEGTYAIWALPVDGTVQKGRARRIYDGRPALQYFSGLSLPRDGDVLYGAVQSLSRPSEVGALPTRPALDASPPSPSSLTRVNDALFGRIEMPSIASVRYPGSRGRDIQAWLLEPPGRDPSRRHPFILAIHGGPQGAWASSFHYRWNLALFASWGYVVLAPNFHGSTGFGQEFTEEISGDWGGAAYDDVLAGTDWAVAQGLADPERMAAIGGSYGGYMVNWILGHTDRFKALVSHAGVTNLESMYGSTEELWFPEWDLGGTPWKNSGSYERFSPHRFAARFRTPTLVVHGELDYRVPVTEGMQLFTALRRQGVEARFLYFPDEGHWVAKPRNSRLWNETVKDWLDRHLKG